MEENVFLLKRPNTETTSPKCGKQTGPKATLAL